MKDVLPIILVVGLLAFALMGQEGPHTAASHWQSYEERHGHRPAFMDRLGL